MQVEELQLPTLLQLTLPQLAKADRSGRAIPLSLTSLAFMRASLDVDIRQGMQCNELWKRASFLHNLNARYDASEYEAPTLHSVQLRVEPVTFCSSGTHILARDAGAQH